MKRSKRNLFWLQQTISWQQLRDRSSLMSRAALRKEHKIMQLLQFRPFISNSIISRYVFMLTFACCSLITLRASWNILWLLDKRSHFIKRTSGDEVCKKHVCTGPLKRNVIYSNTTRKERVAAAKNKHRLHIFHPAYVARFSSPLQKCTHCLPFSQYVLLWTCTRLRERLCRTSRRVIIPLKHNSTESTKQTIMESLMSRQM